MSDSTTSGGITLEEMIAVAKALGLDPATTSVSDFMTKVGGGPSAPPAPPPPRAAPAPKTPPGAAPKPKAPPRGAPTPDATGATTFATSRGKVTLTASEIRACKEAGAKPEVYAENKVRLHAARGREGTGGSATTRNGRSIKLSIGSATVLPTEFRLFARGWNDTEKGRYLFDDAAAKEVMTSYRKWGVDLAIDLEHGMLDSNDSADATARDARGWFKLELRRGELWAVSVKWTPDGAARLAEKRQRYISPAFEVDPETNRVAKIINAAITSIPATHEAPALVAATTR